MKEREKRLLIAVVAVITLLLLPSPVQAQGEICTWWEDGTLITGFCRGLPNETPHPEIQPTVVSVRESDDPQSGSLDWDERARKEIREKNWAGALNICGGTIFMVVLIALFGHHHLTLQNLRRSRERGREKQEAKDRQKVDERIAFADALLDQAEELIREGNFDKAERKLQSARKKCVNPDQRRRAGELAHKLERRK